MPPRAHDLPASGGPPGGSLHAGGGGAGAAAEPGPAPSAPPGFGAEREAPNDASMPEFTASLVSAWVGDSRSTPLGEQLAAVALPAEG